MSQTLQRTAGHGHATARLPRYGFGYGCASRLPILGCGGTSSAFARRGAPYGVAPGMPLRRVFHPHQHTTFGGLLPYTPLSRGALPPPVAYVLCVPWHDLNARVPWHDVYKCVPWHDLFYARAVALLACRGTY